MKKLKIFAWQNSSCNSNKVKPACFYLLHHFGLYCLNILLFFCIISNWNIFIVIAFDECEHYFVNVKTFYAWVCFNLAKKKKKCSCNHHTIPLFYEKLLKYTYAYIRMHVHIHTHTYFFLFVEKLFYKSCHLTQWHF